MKLASPIVPISIEFVKLQFDHWRRRKENKKEPIPDYLWEQVFALDEEKYGISQILVTLGINSTQYRRMKRKLQKDEPLQPDNCNFIEVVNNVPKTEQLTSEPKIQASNVTLEYKRPDGAVLCIKGLAIADINQVVVDFYGGV